MKKPWSTHYTSLGICSPEFDDRPLGSFLEHHAHTTPNKFALYYHHQGIDYAQLNAQSNRLANALVSMNVHYGDVVGIHLPNIPQYVIALSAISKIGAIGSGISPLLAPPEAAYQIQDANIKLIITLSDFSATLTAMEATPACLQHVIVTHSLDFLAPEPFTLPSLNECSTSALLALTELASDEFEQVNVHYNNTFMIQYTGGTTGKPKGAELSHRNIMHNTAQNMAFNPLEQSNDVLLSAFPMFHIAGLANIISSVRYGCTSILVPNPRDTNFVCEQLTKHNVTVLVGVPALYDLMMANPAFAKIDFSALRFALTGGAPLTKASYRALSAIIGENRISDLFGMTETSPCYTCNPSNLYKPGSIGFALPDVNVRIVDVETGTKEMPMGEAGEIICAGPQVMKGYLNKPLETANAIRDIEGQRWMFSGDVGYMDEQGYIFLCDRAKDMLIVGGYKVFSVEVENTLSAMPAIAACAVIGTPDTARGGNEIVHLYVQIAANSTHLNENDIGTSIMLFCRKNMAPYKVPKHIHFIDTIPLTPIGKIDKKVLRGIVNT